MNLTKRIRPLALVVVLPALIGMSVANAFADGADPTVASVGGVPIRLSYVYRHVEALPLGDQIDVRDQLERFTESVIQEEMLFQYGLYHALNQEPALREEIKMLLLDRLIEKHVRSRIDTSDKIVEAYYRDHRDAIRGEHWRVHHIPLATNAQCEALMPRISSLASFTALARQHSTDPALAESSGDLGYIMRHHNMLGLGENLFKLPLHKTHKIDNQDGCHLIWISEYINPPLPPLNEMKDRIRQVIARQQEIELLRALLGRAARYIVVKRRSLPGNVAQNTGQLNASTTNTDN